MLLLQFYAADKLNNDVFMIPTHGAQDSINIGSTTDHKSIAPHILPCHCLTGCDSVSSVYGVGIKESHKGTQKMYSSPQIRRIVRFNVWQKQDIIYSVPTFKPV